MKEWTSIVDLCQRYTKSAYFALKLKQLASRYVHRAEALFFIKVCPFIYDTGLYANTPCIIMFERTIIASIFIVLSLHMFRWETEELGWAQFFSFLISEKWKIVKKKAFGIQPVSKWLSLVTYKNRKKIFIWHCWASVLSTIAWNVNERTFFCLLIELATTKHNWRKLSLLSSIRPQFVSSIKNLSSCSVHICKGETCAHPLLSNRPRGECNHFCFDVSPLRCASCSSHRGVSMRRCIYWYWLRLDLL